MSTHANRPGRHLVARAVLTQVREAPPSDESPKWDVDDATRFGKSVDVALTEFTALRAEIVSRRTRQAALVGVGLTALGGSSASS